GGGGAGGEDAGGLGEGVGTAKKSLSVGNGARSGLWSALLAERGFNGPPAPIEGRQGYLNALAPSTIDWPALTDGLGDTWELAKNTYKPYPCGIVVHPVIDAALALRQMPGFALGGIERIVVRGHPLLAARADRPNVTTGREAQVSVQHSVAAALLFGAASLAQYTDACVRDPAVRALRAKITVEPSETIDIAAATLDVRAKNGASRVVNIPAARGSLARPLTDREIEDKLRALAASWCASHDIQPVIDAVWALDCTDDASLALRLAVPTQT